MKLTTNQKAFVGLVPLVITIVIAFALLFVGQFVNFEISDALKDSLPIPTERRGVQNRMILGANNTTDNMNSAYDIVQVTIIITVLAAAIGAIFMFTRFT